MEIGIVLFFIGFAGLVAGSIMDLRTREVSDWLNYGLMISGVGLRLIESLILWDYHSIFYGTVGFVASFAVGMVMFYSGQWGGGDSKMLMALGALFATYPVFLEEFFNPLLGNIPLLATLFINIILFGGLYGLFWTTFLIVKNFKKFLEEMKKQDNKYRRIVNYVAIVILIMSVVLLRFDRMYAYFAFVISCLLFVTYNLSVSIKSLEKVCMTRYALPKELTEGDWIVDDVMVKNVKNISFKKFEGEKSYSKAVKKLKRRFKGVDVEKVLAGKVKNKKVCEYVLEHHGYDIVGKKIRITGPSDLGIEKEQIEELRKMFPKRKILVKDGIPFVPSFLIAFIVTIVWGNVFLYFI